MSYIIAELGINWLGDFILAEEMVAAASMCGCDYVKTQTWQAKKVRKGPWESEMEIYDKCQLNHVDKHLKFIEICDKYKIKYLTTLFDPEDYTLLPKLQSIKIAGIEADNKLLLDLCTSKFENVFISTCGLSDTEISNLFSYLKKSPCKFFLMYGVYLYPCPLEFANMQRFIELKQKYGSMGYSDHTEGPWASFFAISHGATVIERHFTVSNNLPGIDNKFSCLPAEMKLVCEYNKNFETMTTRSNPDESFILDNFKGRWAGKNG